MVTKRSVPARLHHTATVVRDHEATRHFYEDLAGLPLVATWTEVDNEYGENREYCHTFYGLAEGGALAFFQFADQTDYDQFGPVARPSVYIHTALKVDADSQDAIAAAFASDGVDSLVIDHGFCTSLYANDPDGNIVEFTVDRPDIDAIDTGQRATAHDDLKRWLHGDHTTNNLWR